MKILSGAHNRRNLGISKYIKIMLVLNCHSSATEASVLGYDTASLGNHIALFYSNIMP